MHLPNQSDWLQLASVSSCLLVLVSIARQGNKSHDLIMCTLVDIYKDIVEYYVKVMIII